MTGAATRILADFEAFTPEDQIAVRNKAFVAATAIRFDATLVHKDPKFLALAPSFWRWPRTFMTPLNLHCLASLVKLLGNWKGVSSLALE